MEHGSVIAHQYIFCKYSTYGLCFFVSLKCLAEAHRFNVNYNFMVILNTVLSNIA